jgi:hypothetical protein
MTRSHAEKNAAAEKKAASLAAKGGKKKASDQSTKDMMEETMEEVRGLQHAAEAGHAPEAEVEDDSHVCVSQTATARKRNLSNSPTKERPITTPRAEATSVALSKSLMEKESLLRKKDEELERLSKQVRRLSRESAATSPASPSTPKTPSIQVQCTLFAPRNGDLWSVSF